MINILPMLLFSNTWNTLCEVCHAAGCELSAYHCSQMDFVSAHCKLVQDDKVLVSRHLLKELLHVADLVLEEYDTGLTNAMFLTTWGRFMRISEYTKVRSGTCNHNIAASPINIADDGLGISFISDKTSQASTYL